MRPLLYSRRGEVRWHSNNTIQSDPFLFCWFVMHRAQNIQWETAGHSNYFEDRMHCLEVSLKKGYHVIQPGIVAQWSDSCYCKHDTITCPLTGTNHSLDRWLTTSSSRQVSGKNVTTPEVSSINPTGSHLDHCHLSYPRWLRVLYLRVAARLDLLDEHKVLELETLTNRVKLFCVQSRIHSRQLVGSYDMVSWNTGSHLYFSFCKPHWSVCIIWIGIILVKTKRTTLLH